MLWGEVQTSQVLSVVLEVVANEHDRRRDIWDFRLEITSFENTAGISKDAVHDMTSFVEFDESTLAKVEVIRTAFDVFPVDKLFVLDWTQVDVFHQLEPGLAILSRIDVFD